MLWGEGKVGIMEGVKLRRAVLSNKIFYREAYGGRKWLRATDFRRFIRRER